MIQKHSVSSTRLVMHTAYVDLHSRLPKNLCFRYYVFWSSTAQKKRNSMLKPLSLLTLDSRSYHEVL